MITRLTGSRLPLASHVHVWEQAAAPEALRAAAWLVPGSEVHMEAWLKIDHDLSGNWKITVFKRKIIKKNSVCHL